MRNLDHQELLLELERREKEVQAAGGPERITRQHSQGKMTARERLEVLLDDHSWVEIGAMITTRERELGAGRKPLPGDGVITGYGTIEGRMVFVYAQDFTVLGGTLGEAHAAKIARVMDLAVQSGRPLIGLNDSGGARIQEGVRSLQGYGEIFRRNVQASGVIPQIAVIMGPCAGGAVYSPALMDLIFMVEGTSQMFVTGPQVVQVATGEVVTPEELGGARTHNSRSGVAHFRAASEADCLNLVRRVLSYLPANNGEAPPGAAGGDPVDRPTPELLDIIPVELNRAYDVLEVVQCLVDQGTFTQVHADYAPNLVVGFARLGGQAIGVVANQPRKMAGCLDIDSSDKGARFIRFCDAFNLPLLTLVDTPGYLPGKNQEYGGVIRHGAKMIYAFSEATVPKITLVMRKAFGGAYIAMCSRSLGADYVMAWPTAQMAVMGAEEAVNVIYQREIAAAGDGGEELRRAKINEYQEKVGHPYAAAEAGLIDGVIDPGDTRGELISLLSATLSKRESRLPKKHGNFPV